MTKGRKLAAFLSVLFLVFSLMGCGSNEQAAKKTSQEQKTVKVEKSKDTAKVTPQAETKENTPAVVSASEDSKIEQSTSQTAPVKQTSQTNQAQPTAAKPKTTTATTSKSSSTTTTNQSVPTTTAPKPSTTVPPKPAATVTLSIVGPKDRGTILSATKISFQEGDTIFDVISHATKKQGIVVDSRGTGATAYIEGIDNIYEFDYGVKSGWVFTQNGVSISKSIGVIKVKDGDRIECYYTE